MLDRKVKITIAVLAAAFIIAVPVFASNPIVRAEDTTEASRGIDPDENPTGFGWRFGRGMHGWMWNYEDADGDGSPDLPEGVTPPWDADEDGEPDQENWRFGRGMHGWMWNYEDTDGDGYPDLPEGVTPPWDADEDGEVDPEERPIRGRGWCFTNP